MITIIIIICLAFAVLPALLAGLGLLLSLKILLKLAGLLLRLILYAAAFVFVFWLICLLF